MPPPPFRHPLRLVAALAVICAIVAATVLVVSRARTPHRQVRTAATQTAIASPSMTTASPTPTLTVVAPPPAPTASPPYVVQQVSLHFEDASRPTPSRGSVPGHAGRALPTSIRRPVGAPGPLPLLVFAHGWNISPPDYAVLLDAWASAGYLVAAPTFPDSASTLPGRPVSNYPEQARDVSFLITSLLADPTLGIDPNRIAVAGHSDGGTDVALMALNPGYVDRRIRAYLALSGEIPGGVAGPWGTPLTGSLLSSAGTADQYGLYPGSQQIFQAARTTAKVLMTVAGGDHEGIYDGRSTVAAAVRTETIRFLAAALQPGNPTSAQIKAALQPPGAASIALTAGA